MERKSRFALLVLSTVLLLAGALAWDGRHQVFLHNVRVVESGRIYRGGMQRPGPLRRLIRTHRIRTILSLRGPCDWEERIAREMGVEWIALDLDAAEIDKTIGVELRAAAAVLADASKQPIYFHCIRGWDRSNLVQAAYRIAACGWTVDEAIAELERIGFDPNQDTVDARRRRQLMAFYEACSLAGQPGE